MGDVFFTTPFRRAGAALAFGLITSFVLGSFLSFFVLFTTQAVEGQSSDSAKSTIFRLYAAVFLLGALALHFYSLFWFRKEVRKELFDFTPPRPVIAGVLAVVFLIINAIPITTITSSESFEHANNPHFRESYFGWPAYFVVFRDAYGEKSSEWSRAFLIINSLILLLGAANIFAFDPATKLAEDEAAAQELADREEERKKKKESGDADAGDSPEPPSPPPPPDGQPELRKALTKESSAPRTLDLD